MKSRSAGLNELDPWRRDMGCIPQAEWRVRRVHGGCVRSLCRKPDQKRPVVCFDEKPPIAELAPTDFGQSRPARALRIAITSATAPSVCSSSSTRTGSRRKVNVVDSTRSASPPACAPLATVTSQRQSASGPCWTICPPTPSTLYQAFRPAEARRLLCRLQFHYVPKHASWLSMVEIDIGVLRSQFLDRRIQCTQRILSDVGHGSDNAMPRAPASNGCSQLRKLAPKRAALTPAGLRRKRLNHRAENQSLACLPWSARTRKARPTAYPVHALPRHSAPPGFGSWAFRPR